ncbi:bifunctional nuclease 2 isoform X2 [Cryptomeria japonica]|uniref:bifunctional nuclease 2 isoform X2 n=1 Tax=Cryptomeria japonica TaxID=3369 RepID=UPI0025ACFA20|nr:bifunctional nuclease 2 isoform X2 [Cryptomeria japonica]
MAALQSPVICPSVCVKQEMNMSAMPTRISSLKNRFWGLGKQDSCRARIFKANFVKLTSHKGFLQVQCSSSMSSNNGSGSMAENFSENDEDYVNSSVIEAVESSCMMLMEALRDVQVARPTVYHILKDMIDKMGYEVKLVRVTQRVNQAYFAQLYLNKIGDETEQVSFDLRPSDAINIAVRCKVPIQVNKHIAFSDGMKIIDGFAKVSSRTYKSQDLMTRELDRPDGNTCFATMEFGLVRNMIVAADEERYVDAAKWRDELSQLRTQRSDRTKKV